MDLVQGFQDLAAAYVARERALDEVHAWLVDHAQAVADANDTCLSRITGRAWILISEFDAGHLDEDDVRRGVAQVIAAEQRVSASS